MNKKEKQFSNLLKKYFLKEQFFFDVIESRMTTAGVPDLLVLSPNGVQNFIELKVVEEDYKISLTPGQIAWHSKRQMRSVQTPFIVYVEPRNQMLVMSSSKVLQIILKNHGKLDIDQIPEECWFNRNATDYSMLTFVTADLYFSTKRVYR